jgi:hypothetical protein
VRFGSVVGDGPCAAVDEEDGVADGGSWHGVMVTQMRVKGRAVGLSGVGGFGTSSEVVRQRWRELLKGRDFGRVGGSVESRAGNYLVKLLKTGGMGLGWICASFCKGCVSLEQQEGQT